MAQHLPELASPLSRVVVPFEYLLASPKIGGAVERHVLPAVSHQCKQVTNTTTGNGNSLYNGHLRHGAPSWLCGAGDLIGPVHRFCHHYLACGDQRRAQERCGMGKQALLDLTPLST